MFETQVQHNTECKEPSHDKHLCYLMYEGYHLKHKQEYKELVQDAQYRCQNCGRTAKKSEDLCMPISL